MSFTSIKVLTIRNREAPVGEAQVRERKGGSQPPGKEVERHPGGEGTYAQTLRMREKVLGRSRVESMGGRMQEEGTAGSREPEDDGRTGRLWRTLGSLLWLEMFEGGRNPS